MELTEKLLSELQRRLKIGNRRGVHLNAIPANSRYKFDLNRLSYIDKSLPQDFINALLTSLPLKFTITWKDNVPDLNTLFEEDQTQLVNITKSFENLINQTEAIESEKGINTFGFGFPVLARRDKADNKLTVAPILIWSLRIKRTREFNTWEILRNEDDPIYLNEVLINHLSSDSNIAIDPIPSEMLDDGLINKSELIQILIKLIKSVNSSPPLNLEDTFRNKIELITSIGDKAHYEKLPLNSTNSLIDFGGLFSIFEVQKQNIINEYNNLKELKDLNLNLSNLENIDFQSISAIETDPSQQSVLNTLGATRNIQIQGPPGTGKSQTLTAVLINALENKKKTIVVCEKRTALEVLHNALIEKGLNYHTILIQDIVKDRKKVVNSVRDRVDDSAFSRNTYKYSKDNLDIHIIKAKNLINNINFKHLKLEDKLIGNKNWTSVVGDLLKEIKNNEGELRINIENYNFQYTIEELRNLIETIQEGELLYKKHIINNKKTFIHPLKLNGDNPYLIEQKIHDDFENYAKQLTEINKLFEKIREDFYDFRKNELKNQIEKLRDSVNSINKGNNFLLESNNNIKQFYIELREEKLENQINQVNTIILKIESILTKNTNNSEFLNEKVFKTFSYKLQTLFSSKKRELLADHNLLKTTITELRKTIKSCKYFYDFEISKDLELIQTNITLIRNAIKETQNAFAKNIDLEIEKLNLPRTFLDLDEGKKKYFKFKTIYNYFWQ